MASIREMMMGSWEGRGNAKSAGTHDMPIPGVITSRRVRPAPKKKPPEVKKPVIVQRQPRPIKSHRRDRRSRSRRRRRSSSSSSSRRPREPERKEKDSSPADETDKQREEDDARRREQQEEEERRRRKEAAESWAQQQAEREARRAEEAKVAEDMRQKHAQRAEARKKNLKGAFAMAGADLDDEGNETQVKSKKLAEKQKQQVSSRLSLALRDGEGGSLTSGSATSSETTSAHNEDAVTLRASLADPTAVRSFAPGEVAEKYKLLMEMKRKFRRADFGGPANDVRTRSRSRERRRGRSGSRTRYDSVWIRPTG
eukprot:TRINITY_DN4185_c0_g1_i2.p1 TRINITY_DN4185_c0_g1~~TRINITY_DN4185_c0_g1_i2.p1  ORF type:complete len:355 (+),score=59.20 TRINITY_DN4185_c0_g1_i2:129-1067(+)